MKLFTKKTLAIVLAALIALGSISVAVFAAGEKGTVTTNTVFYDSTGTTPITHAKRGDSVVAKIYVTTDFVAAGLAFEFQYDSNMLELDTSKHTEQSTGRYSIISADTQLSGYFVDGTPNVPSGVDTTGLGTIYTRSTGYTTKQYTDANLYSFYFTVKSTVPVADIGTMIVMPNTNAIGDESLPTDVEYVLDAANNTGKTQAQIVGGDYLVTADYNLTVVSTSENLGVSGKVTFHAGNGTTEYPATFADGSAKTEVVGYNGESVTAADIPADPTWAGYDFVGWSTMQNDSVNNTVQYYYGSFANQSDPKTFSFSNSSSETVDDTTHFYAVYRVATTTYTVNVWQPVLEGKVYKTNTDGSVAYQKNEALTLTNVGGTVNTVIKASDIVAPAGYVNNSTGTMTLVKDSAQNVLNVQLDIAKNNLTWTITDNGTAKTVQTESVYYGTDLSLFTDPTYTGAAETASDFYGYSVNWARTVTTMPNAATEIKGTKGEAVAVTLICDKGKVFDTSSSTYVSGSFTDSDGTKAYKYGDAVTNTPVYVAPNGYTASSWTYKDAAGTLQSVASLASLPDLNKANYTFDTANGFSVTVTPILSAVTDGTVTFNSNGGKWSTTTDFNVTVGGQTYNSAIIGPTGNPDKTDGTYTYTFKGWGTDPNTAAADAKSIAQLGNYTKPVTYYAIYEDTRVTATWKYNDGTVIKTLKGVPALDISGKYPTTSVVLGTIGEPDKTNYATGYSITWDTNVTTVNADTVITGSFTKNTYNIVYVNEAKTEILAKFTGLYGDAVVGTVPTVPAKEGFNAVGWSEAQPAVYGAYTGTITANFGGTATTVNDALIITPVYTEKSKSTVTYTHASGTEETFTGEVGTAFTAPALIASDSKFGYTASWSKTLTQYPTTDTAVTVAYTPIDITISFDPANNQEKSQATAKYNEVVTPIADPVGNGDFLGWFRSNGTIYDFTKSMEANGIKETDLVLNNQNYILELTAKYGIKDTYYNVTGVNADGTFTYSATNVYTTQDAATYTVPADPTLEGFTFKGWATTANATASDITPDGNFATTSRNIYPVYQINKYSVTYYLEDGTTVHQAFADVAFGSAVPKPTTDPTKEGYVFSGWTPAVPATMPNNALTFTATFTAAPVEANEYTATYYNEDTVHAAYVIKEGDPVIIPDDPERFGYVFDGWEPEVPATMPDHNVEFTAQWSVDPTFIALGIGGAVVAGGVIAGVAGTNAALITGGVILGTVAVVGVAANTHKVTYLVDGETYKVYYCLKGTKVFTPKDPTKDGCTFEGWDNEIPEKMPDYDLTFNAQFSTDGDKAPVDGNVPDTGSASAGLAAFAVISAAAAAAYVMSKKKKEF